MRPSRETVNSQFGEIFKAKEAEWKEKHPQPIPPTFKEIKLDVLEGRVTLDASCACKVKKEFSYDYRAPEREDFLHGDMVRVTCVEIFLKQAKVYHKKKSAFLATLRAVRNEAQNDVLYSKANFNEALAKLKAVRV